VGEPFFSVILPVYNGQKYLKESVDSVLGQTVKDWELIIIDDVSTDNTPKIIEECLRLDPRIRSIRNKTNINCGPSANVGIRISKGQWITRIDADDRYRPNYLETLRGTIENFKGKDFFLSSWVTIINDKGDEVLDMKLPDGEKVQRMLPIENFIYHPATSYPKTLWEKVGGYPDIQKEADDRVLWGKFFKAGAQLVVVPKALMQYRIHLGNMSFDFESGNKIYDPAVLRVAGKDAEWKISLFLKQTLLKEARAEIKRLIQQDHHWTVKRFSYFCFTYFPAPFVRFFMWEFRPRVRHILRKLQKKT